MVRVDGHYEFNCVQNWPHFLLHPQGLILPDSLAKHSGFAMCPARMALHGTHRECVNLSAAETRPTPDTQGQGGVSLWLGSLPLCAGGHCHRPGALL